MISPPVHEDNPQALVRELSPSKGGHKACELFPQVDKPWHN